MNSLELLLLSVLLYMGSALLSLLCSRAERTAINLCGVGGMAAGVAGLAATLPVMLSGRGMIANLGGPFAFAQFTVRLDPLAAFMVFVISLLATITSLYSLSYVREYEGRGAWAMGFFMNTFIAAMVALMVVDNAFYFLVFFEMMSLASYFLVVFDQHDEAVSAGFLYFLIAHAGSVLIMGAFFILYTCSGSMAFESFRHLHLSAPLASIVFLLAFFGFGAKAGIIPLHSWLPRAHPAAPSHGSALMSGVMVKVGVFGIIKVGIDLLGATSAWWGLVVLGFGAISAVLGVLYAMTEKDAKRLLAYSSVENVGIILMGVGVGMIGIATGRPALGILGLLGALYHLINHAVFKGLLFLGAGSILFRTHTKDMEKLGGLGRLMPYTAAACLVGAMAISALPPLNGFVSEWFTYQSLFSMSLDGGFAFRLAGPIAVVMLAITGALAAMCFVKFYGLIFSGKARSEHAAHAHEAPAAMTWAMGLLALIAIALGLCAPLVAPIITRIASSLVGQIVPTVVEGFSVYPIDPKQAMLSTPLIAILLLAAPILAILLVAVFKGERLGRRHGGAAWACGYEQEEKMLVSADGFSKPVKHMFDPLFRLRSALDPAPCLHASLQRVIAGATRVEPMWEDKVISPIVRVIQWIGTKVQWLQHGDFRIYCLYVVAALVVFLMIAVA